MADHGLDMISATMLATPVASVENDGARFTLFPSLPLELRKMIWKEALPGPRIITILPQASVHPVEKYDQPCRAPLPIHVRTGYRRPFNRDCLVPGQAPKLAPSNAISPALLYINSESRNVALKRYKVAFASQISSPVYFDFEQDSIYLPSMADIEHFTDPEGWRIIVTQSSKLKHLILGVRWAHHYIRECVDAITEMNDLDTLTLTVDDYLSYHDGSYFTPQDKADLFLVDWRWVNRGIGVSKEEAGEPKVVSWLGLADVKSRARIGGLTGY